MNRTSWWFSEPRNHRRVELAAFGILMLAAGILVGRLALTLAEWIGELIAEGRHG